MLSSIMALILTSATWTPQHPQIRPKTGSTRSSTNHVGEPNNSNLGQASQPTRLYDFKGAQLGMSIDAWRELKPDTIVPSERDISALFSYCDNQLPRDQIFILNPDKRYGVIACSYFYLANRGSETAELAVGDGSSRAVSYYFLNDKLFYIDIGASIDAYDSVVVALTAKFGQPTRSSQGVVHNRIGGTLDKTVVIWDNPAAAIKVESPAGSADRLSIDYVDHEAWQRLNAIKQALQPSSSKM